MTDEQKALWASIITFLVTIGAAATTMLDIAPSTVKIITFVIAVLNAAKLIFFNQATPVIRWVKARLAR